MLARAFLRIPPFPGHRAQPLAAHANRDSGQQETAAGLIDVLRSNRVGGNFWSGQPAIPNGRTLLLAPGSPSQLGQMIDKAMSTGAIDKCFIVGGDGHHANGVRHSIPHLTGTFDPWYLAEVAAELWVDANEELALVATLAGQNPVVFGRGSFERCGSGERSLEQLVDEHLLSGQGYRCPFSGETITAIRATEILADWRRLIDRNREIGAIYGVAGWKRPTLDGLLWNGSVSARYESRFQDCGKLGRRIAAWKSRTPGQLLARLERSDLEIAELEDGMIRGPGLGANCVPPLSIVVDHSGIYFDPSQASDLETILQSGAFDGQLIERAARLRALIISSGISKYGGESRKVRKDSSKRRILVAGQVEDDRSILKGGAGQTNLELLQRARSLEPGAWLIYRPHPDVEAGHRKGHVREEDVLRFADEIDRSGSVISLIEAVDGVHCITSLSGFEALLRGTPVTTHGVPFYAGWGLTNDLATIPDRRTRRRSLDELIAATLILYPRYLDPVTRLPCAPEILVERIAKGEGKISAPWSKIRILQGKLNLALRRLREVAV